jgi:predicted acylesterase/phospholipase RssA
MKIEDAIYASCVMPVYFPPLVAREVMGSDGSVFVDAEVPSDFRDFLRQGNPLVPGPAWRHFFDGGLADIAPIRTAMRLGYREITVVGVSPLHMSTWMLQSPHGVDPVKTPTFQYFMGFMDVWGLNVARSDIMLGMAANEFMGWLYRLQAMMPPEVAARARTDFDSYARSRRGVLSNLLGNTTWFGGSVPMDPAQGGDEHTNEPFFDEAYIIRVVAPTEPLPLMSTQFHNAVGVQMARDIGARRMQELLDRPEEMVLSRPVAEEQILTIDQARAFGI